MKRYSWFICLTFLVFNSFVSVGVNATVIDFESLYTGSQRDDIPIPLGYGGFNWGASCFSITKNFLVGSGYDYGTQGNVSLYNSFASSISMQSSVKFNFTGAYITSAWDTTQNPIVEGWRDGSPIYTETLTTGNDKAYWFDFNYTNIDTIWFKSNGGLHLCIDNITYNTSPVPLPPSVWLFGSSLVGLIGLRRFSRS